MLNKSDREGKNFMEESSMIRTNRKSGCVNEGATRSRNEGITCPHRAGLLQKRYFIKGVDSSFLRGTCGLLEGILRMRYIPRKVFKVFEPWSFLQGG